MVVTTHPKKTDRSVGPEKMDSPDSWRCDGLSNRGIMCLLVARPIIGRAILLVTLVELDLYPSEEANPQRSIPDLKEHESCDGLSALPRREGVDISAVRNIAQLRLLCPGGIFPLARRQKNFVVW